MIFETLVLLITVFTALAVGTITLLGGVFLLPLILLGVYEKTPEKGKKGKKKGT